MDVLGYVGLINANLWYVPCDAGHHETQGGDRHGDTEDGHGNSPDCKLVYFIN